MSGKPIDIMLASDRRGVEPVTVAAYSAIRFASRPVRVWMVEEDIEPALQAAMTAEWARLPMFAGATFRALAKLPHPFPSWWRRENWPLMSCARFQAAELLPPDAERCIYLDYDTLTGTDLAELADIDMRGLPIGMVPNFGFDEQVRGYIRGELGLDPDTYCNAGVLIADLALWRREDVGRKLIAYGKAMPPNIWFFDQDMLNSFFRDRLLLLDERWNLRDGAAQPEGNVLHFAGGDKPWRTLGGDPPLAGLLAWRRMREELTLAVPPQAPSRGLGQRAQVLRARVERKLIEIGRRFGGASRG